MPGTIDQLNFEVILRDEKFDKQIKKDIELAKKLNASLTEILNLKNKINAASKASFIDEQKLAREAAKTAEAKAKQALAEQKVRTEAEKTAAVQAKARAAIEQSAKALAGSPNSFTRVWLRFSATFWSIISLFRLFTRAIGDAIRKISEFEQANANLATIMQVSRKEVEVLTNDALMLGRTTEWTASQVTELQTALAKLGYNIPQIQNMQASVLQFATAVGANLPDAANLAGASLRMFGMHSSEMQKALEILTASTNKTALDFDKLKVALPYVGAIAHSIGFDIAETASLLGVLANSGLAASRTGTGLRQVLLELSKQNGKLQTAMGGNIRTFDDFVNGLQLMRDRGLEAGEATKLVSTRASSALLILANGVDEIKRLNDEVRDTDGLLNTIQAERLDTLHGSTLLLKSAWEGLIQTFRDSAGPMKDIVDWLTEIIRMTSLAASRANRVAQGTKNGDVIGSDDLTKQFRQHYDNLLKSLLEDGKSAEEAAATAAAVVQKEMDDYLNDAMSKNTRPGLDQTGWYKFITNSVPIVKRITKGVTRKSRAADEQVEAVENAMSAVTDYMASRSAEEGEIAAKAYLEKWRMIFDTQGEAAARAAMKSVAGYEDVKNEMEAFIANGGSEGAIDRGRGNENEAEQRRRKFVEGLKKEASYLRKLADDYAKLEPYLGPEGASKKMSEIFGDDGDYSMEGIEKQVSDIIDVLRNKGKEGFEGAADAAEELERSWGLDKVSRAVKQLKDEKKAADDAQKSLEKYLDALEKYTRSEKELSGTGASFKISKAISDYRSALNKNAGDFRDISQLAGAAFPDSTSKAKAYLDLYGQWAQNRVAAMATLRQSISQMADDVFNEGMRGYDLTDWNDKTLSQVLDIKKAVESMEIPSDIKAMLKDYPELLALLEQELNRLKQEKVDKTIDPERFKKIAGYAKKVSGYFSTAADALRGLADATGDSKLADSAEVLGMIAQNMQAAADGAESWGGWWGAIIGGISDLIEQAFTGITDSIKKARELAETIRVIRDDAWIASNMSLFSQGNIFGENGGENLRGAVEAMDRIREDMEVIGDPKITRNGMSFWDKVSVGWRIMYNSGHIAPEEFMSQGTLSEVMQRYGMNMYDENGILDPKSIRKVIEMFGDTDGVLERLAKDAEAYAEAMKVVEDTAESIVGGVVGDLADKIVDSWFEAGQAALDYADILEDVAKGYAKLVVQDMLMEAAFDDNKRKQFIDALKNGDAQTAMATVAGAMQAAQEMLPAVESALQVFEPYRNIGGGAEGNSVGSGIKSITEETASLLASYINAIRADVSIMRGIQERGFADVSAVGSSLPSLVEYMTQVAANTYDTAQNTNRILSELQSVIGAPGTSGMVVRVESY